MKIYRSKCPFIISKSQFAKNQHFLIIDDLVYVQGRLTTIDISVFEEMINNKFVVETIVSDDFVQENILLNKDYVNIKNILSKSKKNLSKYKNVLKTIEKWAFIPKGSAAANIEEEIKFQNNPEKVLKPTILGDGMKAKPGDVHMNRGTQRHGPYVIDEDINKWLSDSTTLLPYGIRKSDYAPQSEQVKIFKKIIRQVVSMEDCPLEFKSFFEKELNFVTNPEPLLDYLGVIDRKTREHLGHPKLLFSDFEQNKHHSKENGLEICHLDPWLEFPTVEENITIGSCRANRLQGGYPIWYIKEIFK
jgi:hypothetical protein